MITVHVGSHIQRLKHCFSSCVKFEYSYSTVIHISCTEPEPWTPSVMWLLLKKPSTNDQLIDYDSLRETAQAKTTKTSQPFWLKIHQFHHNTHTWLSMIIHQSFQVIDHNFKLFRWNTNLFTFNYKKSKLKIRTRYPAIIAQYHCSSNLISVNTILHYPL